MGTRGAKLNEGNKAVKVSLAEAEKMYARLVREKSFQAFRLPLELVMHEAARAGVMPPQMSFSGWNFDIVTGITACLLAPLIASGKAPRALIVTWNALGAILLTIIVSIAVASTPVFHAFGDGAMNTFIAYLPFVFLPAVMVACALVGHVLVARWLLRHPG